MMKKRIVSMMLALMMLSCAAATAENARLRSDGGGRNGSEPDGLYPA